MAALGLAMALGAAPAGAQAATQGAGRWSVEFFGGTAASARTPLRIRQAGWPSLDFSARYRTHPWSGSPYYAYRLGRWTGRRAWEVELVHHKLYLHGGPPAVERFEITHGYNLVFANRAVRAGWGEARIGVGPVIAHAENVVRGRALASDRGGLRGGYRLAGLGTQLTLGRRVALGGGWSLVGEGKATAAYARVPVAGGRASVPNLAVHGLLGVGYVRR